MQHKDAQGNRPDQTGQAKVTRGDGFRDGAHEFRMRVRYADTDQMGIAHHANYLAFMEMARVALLVDLGSCYAECERRGVALPIRKVEIRYRAPSYFDDELLIRTRVEALGKASVRFRYELFRVGESTELANGMTELACVNMHKNMRPQALPAEMAEQLSRVFSPTQP